MTGDKKTKNDAVHSSVFVHLVFRFFSYLAAKLKSSAIMSFIAGFREEANPEKSSFYAQKIQLEEKLMRKSAAVKRKVSRQFADSKAMTIFKKIRYAMLRTSLRSYGISVLLFGIYSAAIAVMKHYMTDRWYLDDSGIVSGIICIVAGLIMLSSPKPLIELLCESSSMSLFIRNILCVRTDEVLAEQRVCRPVMLPLAAATVFGLATYFVPADRILLYLGAILLFTMLLFSPEFGVIAFIFLLPFVKENFLFALILTVFISYLIKYIRGKRVFSLGATELLPAIIGIIGLLRCLIGYEGSPVGIAFAVSLPLLYMSVQNMFRSRYLLFSLADMLGTSFFIIYGVRILYCIALYFGADADRLFSFAAGVSDPGTIGEYAALCMGFALYSLTRVGLFSRKVTLCAVMSLSVTVMFAMKNAALVLAAIAAVLVYAVASRQKDVIFSLPVAAVLPVCYLLFSSNDIAASLVSVFTAGNTGKAVLNGKDFLYMFGIGGVLLIAVFILLSLSKRMSVHCGVDDKRRSVYAATTSSAVATAVYLIAGGGGLAHPSVLFIVTVAALSSAFNRDNTLHAAFGTELLYDSEVR